MFVLVKALVISMVLVLLLVIELDTWYITKFPDYLYKFCFVFEDLGRTAIKPINRDTPLCVLNQEKVRLFYKSSEPSEGSSELDL